MTSAADKENHEADSRNFVIGAVSSWRGNVLLVKLPNGPGGPGWYLPASEMLEGESSWQTAARKVETYAANEVAADGLLAVYDVPADDTIFMYYRATLPSDQVLALEENEKAALFDWPDIPWDDLVLTQDRLALEQFNATFSDIVLTADLKTLVPDD